MATPTLAVSEVFGPTMTAAFQGRGRATVTDDGCWVWQRSRTSAGYGAFWLNGGTFGAHRVMFESVYGPIPDGLHVHHICEVRLCVNPAHLAAVTPQQNTLASDTPARRNAMKTECVHGHSLADAYLRSDGRRRCRTCEQTASRNRQRAKRGVPEDWPAHKHYHRRSA